MANGEAHHSLARALDILEAVAVHREGYTLTELSELLHIAKSSISPLLHTLTNRNYLARDPATRRYTIGSMAFRVGNNYLVGDNVMWEIQRRMEYIVQSCRETCYLGRLQDGDVFYLKSAESMHPTRSMATAGRLLPAYATAVGKALLADYTLPQLRVLYYDGLAPLTPRTVTQFNVLEQQLERVRATGFAYECEESTPGVRCVAVPIRKGGRVVLALSIAMAVERYTDELADKAERLLTSARYDIEAVISRVDISF